MEYPYSENLKQVADSMGIGLHQRFTLNEAALFLRCKVDHLQKLKRLEQINYLRIPGSEVEFFGHHLLEYLLASSTSHNINTPQLGSEPDRILRTKEVQEITGLSRTTLWRMENRGDFPRRVSLGVGAIGWRFSEVELWLSERERV